MGYICKHRHTYLLVSRFQENFLFSVEHSYVRNGSQLEGDGDRGGTYPRGAGVYVDTLAGSDVSSYRERVVSLFFFKHKIHCYDPNKRFGLTRVYVLGTVHASSRDHSSGICQMRSLWANTDVAKAPPGTKPITLLPPALRPENSIPR